MPRISGHPHRAVPQTETSGDIGRADGRRPYKRATRYKACRQGKPTHDVRKLSRPHTRRPAAWLAAQATAAPGGLSRAPRLSQRAGRGLQAVCGVGASLKEETLGGLAGYRRDEFESLCLGAARSIRQVR
jgi:hypothetical protein